MYHLDITCYVNRSLIERLFFLKNVRASKRTKISQQSLSCWAHKNIQLFLKVWNLIQLLVGTNQTFWLHNINFDNNVPELPLRGGGQKKSNFYRFLPIFGMTRTFLENNKYNFCKFSWQTRCFLFHWITK